MSLYGYYFTVVEQQLIYFVNDIFFTFAVPAICRRNIEFVELKIRPNSIIIISHERNATVSKMKNCFGKFFILMLRLKLSSEPKVQAT